MNELVFFSFAVPASQALYLAFVIGGTQQGNKNQTRHSGGTKKCCLDISAGTTGFIFLCHYQRLFKIQGDQGSVKNESMQIPSILPSVYCIRHFKYFYAQNGHFHQIWRLLSSVCYFAVTKRNYKYCIFPTVQCKHRHFYFSKKQKNFRW